MVAPKITLGREYILILSSWSIYSRIAFSFSFVRVLFADAGVLFDILLFHCFCKCRTKTQYIFAACVQFDYHPSWITSQASLIPFLIAEYELEAMLLSNHALISTDKYEKIQLWDQRDVKPVFNTNRPSYLVLTKSESFLLVYGKAKKMTKVSKEQKSKKIVIYILNWWIRTQITGRVIKILTV